MARFFLLETIITAGVLFIIFKLVVWISRTAKKQTDEVDKCLNKEQKEKK